MASPLKTRSSTISTAQTKKASRSGKGKNITAVEIWSKIIPATAEEIPAKLSHSVKKLAESFASYMKTAPTDDREALNVLKETDGSVLPSQISNISPKLLSLLIKMHSLAQVICPEKKNNEADGLPGDVLVYESLEL